MKYRFGVWGSLLACLSLVLAILPASPTSALPVALLPADTAVSWEASLDGSEVLYRTNANELRAVRVSDHADALITASANLVLRSVLSPNGAYVAFFKTAPGGYELWLAATDGSGSRLVLTAPSDQFGGMTQAKFTPNGSHFLYTTTPTNALKALYSVATVGNAAPVLLNPPPFMTFEIHRYIASPDSSHVVFSQIITNANYDFVNVYSVPVDGPGSASVKLNRNGPSTVYYGELAISPDSQRVVLPDSGFYSMDLNGGNRVQLSPAGAINALAVSADSTRIVYGWMNGSTMNGEYYVVPINGPMSAAVQVISVHQIEMDEVTFTADGARIVAYVRLPGAITYSLYSTPTQGPASAAVDLSAGLTLTSRIQPGFEYRPTSHIAVGLGSSQLWSLPVAGPASAPQLLSPGARDFAVTTPDGARVVYTSNNQVYSVPIAGPLSATRNESLSLNGGSPISAIQVAENSQRLFFSAGGAVYVTALGTGLPVAWLQPECQSVAPTPGPTPTTTPGLVPRLYLPAVQRCEGVK